MSVILDKKKYILNKHSLGLLQWYSVWDSASTTRARVQSLVRELGAWVLHAVQPSQTNKQKLCRFPPAIYLRWDILPLDGSYGCQMSSQYFLVRFLPSLQVFCYLSFCVEYWIISSNLTYHFTGYFFCCIQYVTRHADIVTTPLFSRSSVVLISNVCHFL